MKLLKTCWKSLQKILERNWDAQCKIYAGKHKDTINKIALHKISSCYTLLSTVGHRAKEKADRKYIKIEHTESKILFLTSDQLICDQNTKFRQSIALDNHMRKKHPLLVMSD